jgi:hypothetical protein
VRDPSISGIAQVGEFCQVYVALLDEGTSVWRPVAAEPIEPGLFRLIGPMPDNERWMFSPGAEVRCEDRMLSGRLSLIAIECGRPERGAGPDRGNGVGLPDT